MCQIIILKALRFFEFLAQVKGEKLYSGWMYSLVITLPSYSQASHAYYTQAGQRTWGSGTRYYTIKVGGVG